MELVSQPDKEGDFSLSTPRVGRFKKALDRGDMDGLRTMVETVVRNLDADDNAGHDKLDKASAELKSNKPVPVLHI